MQICIPIEFKAEGGGFYFLQMFEDFLEDRGWKITRDVKSRFDVLFTNHWMTSRRQILRAIRYNPRVRIVQRIDGVAKDYGRDPEADLRQSAVNKLADLTIFQSQYARYAAMEKFPVIGQDGPIIHNPVDVDTFSPNGEKLKGSQDEQVICVSWSSNPYKGAAKIYAVAAANPDINFLLCGNFPDAPVARNLHKVGVLNRSNLAAAYRSCRVLLTFSRNEACPNHVLEALASGLPVLFEDSGATSELVGEYGAPVTEDNFPDQFRKVIKNWPDLSAGARKVAVEKFHPEVVFPKYLGTMEKALLAPTHVSLLPRSLMAWAGTVGV
jgi:glycosyltransferase involved in cell wall biosynthesis